MREQPYNLVPAHTYPLSALASLLTKAYADYAMPIFVNEDILKRIVDKWDICLEQSVVAEVDEKPVGLAFLSQRGTRGWISSVGVVKAYRHRGIARAMLSYLQHKARTLGLRQVCLDVLDTNAGAFALYESAGFVRAGAGLTLQKEVRGEALGEAPVDEEPFKTVSMDAAFALAFYPQFSHARAAWVRDEQALHKLCAYGLKGFGYLEDRSLQGYILYTGGLGTYDIYDLAVADAHPHRLAIAQALLRAVETLCPYICQVYVINVAEEDPFLDFYRAHGYGVFYQEYEMCWFIEA